MRLICSIILVALVTSCGEKYPKEVKTKHPNGNIREIFAINEKQDKNGPFVTYYENGEMQSEGNYLDGQLEGLCRTYHLNGKIESSINYVAGKPVGEADFYYETGVVRKRETYNDFHQKMRVRENAPNGYIRLKGAYLIEDQIMHAFVQYDALMKKDDKTSNYIEISRLKGRDFQASIHSPETETFDSIVVYTVKNIGFRKEAQMDVMKIQRFSQQPMKINVTEADYFNYKLNHYFKGYYTDDNGNVQSSNHRLFWHVSQTVPADNVDAIHLVD